MIDCDVHNDWATAEVLLPYMDPNFKDYFVRGELPGPQGSFPHANRPWLHPEGFRRTDIQPETQEEHYTIMKETLLDKCGHEVAVLTGEEAIEASTLANPYYATALVKAYNDWLVDYWLPKDKRFKGSLVVAQQDPEGSAEEIRRLGEHPDIVQVLMSSGSQRPYGDRFYWPIWEAAAEVGLPVAIHLGGQGGLNANPVSSGPTTYFWTTHALLLQTGMTHTASVLASGIFEKWPKMKFIIIECGVAWAPGLFWRLDANYKALRKETPWLKHLPSEYAQEHVFFATQPLEQPKNPEHLWAVLDAIDGKNTLLFASDYPHWDFDDPKKINIPKDWHENVFRKNAERAYGEKIQPRA